MTAGQEVDVEGLAAGGGLIWAYGWCPDLSVTGGNDTSVVTALDPRSLRTVSQWRIPGADDSIVYDDGALYPMDLAQGLVFRTEPGQRVRAFRSIRESESIVSADPRSTVGDDNLRTTSAPYPAGQLKVGAGRRPPSPVAARRPSP